MLIGAVFLLSALAVTATILVLWLVWGREKYALGGRTGQVFPQSVLRPSTAFFLAALIFIAIMELSRI